MRIIDYWRCENCRRILAERVMIGLGCSITGTCWGCGQVMRLGDALEIVQTTVPVVALESPVSITRKGKG